MSERLYDIFTCFKLSLKIFLIPLIIGTLIGTILGLRNGELSIVTIITWIFSVGTWVSSLGLVVCAVSFMKTDFLGDLNHQRQWRKYFYRLNLVPVMFFICMFIYGYLIILDYIKYIIK